VSGWLTPLAATLDAIESPCPFFFRDDDAGWDDFALMALLDEFDAAGVTVDVAAIPQALTPSAGRLLAARLDGGMVRIHQHGYAHVNHETSGRKCEFGPSRSAAEQAADICAGRARLEQVLMRDVDPVFTPPWNRCTADTAAAVLAAGHVVLSRDHTAGLLRRPGLAEVPVTVDWSATRKGVLLSPADRGRSLAAAVSSGRPVGVMLHHAVLAAEDRDEVRRLLDLVNASPAATVTSILELARTTTESLDAESPARPRAERIP
jgi:hypothetical protein